MPISSRNARIGGASLVALLLVGLGYVLPGLNVPETKPVNAALTDDILASYVSKDVDADGLPDWQEVLYGTDSNNPDTDGDGITDGDAVRRGLLTPVSLSSELPTESVVEEDIPGEPPAKDSFTERFSRTFFEEYVRTSGGQPMEEDAQQALVTKLLGRFTSEASASLGSRYTRASVRTDAFTNVAAYTARVEQVLDTAIPDAPDSDMIVLTQKVIEEDSAPAAARLNELGDQYLAAARGLLTVPAPPAYVETHLRLIRGFEEGGRAAKAVSTYKEDPLLTMGALAMFAPARTNILQSFDELAAGILMIGEPLPGSPGYLIVNAVRSEQER